ncbi:glycoside hydrolase family 26 protein [Rufibacter tibetensis]|uniref:Mannan endo-1,4-beta-mannosidase n=1 Tax=Rufibacter tibetensis TaxID=512763 RepID=A0A0P0CVL0_9BACT|nr:glycosyl hydrolase [Rufibacter tibetensis]ALI98489.1 beta-mannosidase [Rufibacter tibetensis]
MIRILLASFFLAFTFSSSGQTLTPINKKATPETRNLYANLKRLSQKGIMFGHQDALAYGMGWKYEPGRSDVKEIVGEYPAVVGWDLGHLELKHTVNLDSVPFDKMRQFAQEVYANGGLNTISWHLNNPLDPTKTSWDPMDSTIQHLFKDKKALKRYKSWLEDLAGFMRSLKGPNGELIPVIFRPLHEHTGSWFWWGRKHCSPEEYKQMWRFTVDYLRKKKANNLLFAYSTDRFTSREDYLERYPGDDYVDIVGFDIYHRPPADTAQLAQANQTFIKETRQMVETLRQIGQEKNKVWTLSETGLETLPIADWWTNVLTPIVKDAGLSYVMVWRNGRPDHYYAPYPGQKSEADFKTFYNNPNVFFIKKVAQEKLYAPPAQNK